MFDQLSDKIAAAVKTLRGKGRISEQNIEEAVGQVRTALLEADVNFTVVRDFIQKVRQDALGTKVLGKIDPGEQFIKIIHDQLLAVMGTNEELDLKRAGVLPIMIVGPNGQGKTTFSGKIAHYFKTQGHQVLLIPADNFRPAAKEQLKVLAAQADVAIFDSDLSQSAAQIARNGLNYAKQNGFKIAIIDTAGRLHVDEELMNQLAEVKAALAAERPEVWLVADAMIGQAAVAMAESFQSKVGLTGVVLSKMDFDARGGAALSIKYVTGLPIRFISQGEKLKDLDVFHPDRLVGRILDMGDVVSLVEKAQAEIDEKEASSMAARLQKGKFSIADLIKQMEMMKKLGGLGQIMGMLPGLGGLKRQLGDLAPAEQEMRKVKVIASSMTKAERDNYHLIDASRTARIARGSGNSVADVEAFLAKFGQMEQMMSSLMTGGLGGFLGGGGMPGMPGKKKNKPKQTPWGKSYF